MGIASWSLLLVLLSGLEFISLCCAASSDHSSHGFTLFLHMNDLKKGTAMPIYLAKEDFSKTHFLPREEADSIPFSSRNLPELRRLFARSPMASLFEGTISICESPPLIGETKFCATSLESMLDFVLRVFEIDPDSGDSPPTLLTSSFRTKHRELIQNYTIIESPVRIPARKIMGCHTLAYPYSVALCHSVEGDNRAFKMLMRGDNGDLIDMIVACHLDTWQWDPHGAPFAALGTRPGDPVCHVFPPHGNFLWVIRSDDSAHSSFLS